MYRWVEAAKTVRISDACKAANVSFVDYREGRRADPAFDEACRLHDQAIDLMIVDSLRHDAADGDIRSQTLYYNRVRDLILGAEPDAHSDPGTALSPEVAEAMTRAGLEALGLPSEGSPSPPLPAPACKAKRPAS